MLAEGQITVTKSDIEDCHRLGKNGNTTVRFVNRKFCNDILDKKLTYTKILTSLNLVLLWTLGFMSKEILLLTTNVSLKNAGSYKEPQ